MLYGAAGVTSLLARGEGFKEALKKQYPEMKILAERFCEVSRAEGLKQMEDFLQAFPGQINGVYTGGSYPRRWRCRCDGGKAGRQRF